MPTTAQRRAVLGPLRLRRLGDARLAELAAAGDERAFEVVYDRHHRALLGFCRHMVGSPDEAEDALQQTFLRAIANSHGRRSSGGPCSTSARCARRNVCWSASSASSGEPTM